MWSILGALGVAITLAIPAWAQDAGLEDRVKKLEDAMRKTQEQERPEGRVERREEAPRAGHPPSGTGPITEIKVERAGEEKVPLSFGSTGSGKLIYAKPFLSAPKSTIGGYGDIQFNALTGPNLDNRARNTFNQVRMIPFIYADITDRVKFATEIEFERGGPQNNQSDGEIKLEFAQIDYLVNEMVNLRAGIILVPVGKFNLLHDSPLNDLVDRPMVSRLIIPSTWSEAGAGIYGTLYPSRLSKLDYEFYVVNGFQSQTSGGAPISPSDTNGLRSVRGSMARDPIDNKAVVGRVAFSPMLGIEVAGSAFYGQWNNKGPGGVNNRSDYIGIYALDWTLQKGPFELIGEAAWSRIEGNNVAGSFAPQGPVGMQGYYVQGNYHFMPEFLKKLAPTHFTDASTFTAVIRWERVDTDTTNITRTATNGNQRELERLTIGLNFRPIEDTVFKFDYQFNTQKDTPITNFVNNPAGNITTGLHGNGFMFMAATYF
jgi:hypothetical protein